MQWSVIFARSVSTLPLLVYRVELGRELVVLCVCVCVCDN